MKKIFSFFLFTFFLTASLLEGAFISRDWGARPVGLGGSFVGLADDANAVIWNPGGIAQLDQGEATFMYAKPFAGLENVSVSRINAGGVYPLQDNLTAVGAAFTSFSGGGEYSESAFFASCGRKIPTTSGLEIFVGGNLKYLTHGFSVSGTNSSDSVFASGTSKAGFTADLGTICKPNPQTSIGLAIRNIIEPDLGLKAEDRVLREIWAGGAYRAQASPQIEVVPSLGLLYKQGGIHFSIGGEAWFMEGRVGLRAGYNSSEVAFGGSYRLKGGGTTGIELAYAYALPYQMEATGGNHNISLGIRFGEKRAKEELLREEAPVTQEETPVTREEVSLEEIEEELEEEIEKEEEVVSLPEEEKVIEEKIEELSADIYLPKHAFSPDGDGVDDFCKIHLKVEAPDLSSWQLKITDPRGTVVKTFEGEETGVHTLEWDGRDASEEPVSLGTYKCTLYVEDKSGQTAMSKTEEIKVE